MGRKTFKLPEEMVERHKPRKEASGLSWPEYWDGQAPEYEPVTAEDVRQIVREECDSSSASNESASNDDILTELKTLREDVEKIRRQL